MSVAPELPPIVHIPARARRGPRALTLVALGTVPPHTHFADLAGEPGGVVIPLRPARGFDELLESGRVGSARPTALGLAPDVELALSVAAPAVAAPAVAGVQIAPVRLTARGRAVLAVMGLLAAGLLLLIAHASIPASAATASNPAVAAGTSVVAVQPGDTLWSIASRVAPTRDPRAEVLDLQKINHLSGVDVFPGQVLHVK
jgi:LysM repeat protein